MPRCCARRSKPFSSTAVCGRGAGEATSLLGALMARLMREIGRRTGNGIASAGERQKPEDTTMSLPAGKARAGQGEARTRHSSSVLQAMLEHFPIAVSVVDRDLNIIAFNQKFLTHLDFPAGLIEPGVPMAKVFRYNAERGEYGPGDPQEQVRQRLELAAQFLPHKFERTRPDGIVLEIVGNPIPGLGFVTTYTDITARKRADEELHRALQRAEQAETLLSDAIDCVSEAFVIYDKDDRLVLCNDVYRRLYPRTAQSIQPGMSFEALLRHGLAAGEYQEAIGREDQWLAERISRHQQASGAVEQHLADGRHLLISERRMKSGGIAGPACRRHRSRVSQRSLEGSPRQGRGRQPGEIDVSRQYEPRAAHALECHHRLLAV